MDLQTFSFLTKPFWFNFLHSRLFYFRLFSLLILLLIRLICSSPHNSFFFCFIQIYMGNYNRSVVVGFWLVSFFFSFFISFFFHFLCSSGIKAAANLTHDSQAMWVDPAPEWIKSDPAGIWSRNTWCKAKYGTYWTTVSPILTVPPFITSINSTLIKC